MEEIREKTQAEFTVSLDSDLHELGATGVSPHVIAAMQLTGTAGDMQLANPRRAVVQNMGGTGITKCLSVLKGIWHVGRPLSSHQKKDAHW
nr:hypothetical protein [Pseudarthrobacter sp. NIBRBAC000502772]